PGIRVENPELETLESHVPRDVCAQRPQRMRQRRNPESRMEFLRDRSAAHHFAALQHHRLEPALCQIICGDQRVVTPANEHYFLSDGHGQFAAFFHSFRMTWLAMRPFAAMMPPPGCVAEPHI